MDKNDSSVLKNYSSPTAPTNIEYEREWPKLSMFNWHGRIGRLRFISWSIKIYFLILIISMLLGGIIAAITERALTPNATYKLYSLAGVFVVALMMQVLATMKRLQDFNVNRWLVLLIFIPLINVFLALVCLFKGGDEEHNQYGPPEPPLTIFDGIIICLLMFIGISYIIVSIP